MAKFIINGGRPLRGTLKPTGNKNAALPMLAAAVLTDEPVILRNVPDIDDVRVMLAILDELGADVEQRGSTVTVRAATLKKTSPSKALCSRVRSSILFAGPLAARSGRATLYPPGGDVIGHRRIDTHIKALSAVGIRCTVGATYVFRSSRPRGAEVLLDEASVTATENALMAATLIPGKTVIYNAACEPHVENLGRMLVAMGARIDGLGTNRIIVRGVKRLRGVSFAVDPDYIEICSYLAAAAVTRGSLSVTGISRPAPLRIIEPAFQKLGLGWTIERRVLSFAAPRAPKIVNDLGSVIPKIEDGTWPAFPSDLMSVGIVAATQSKGSVLFFEKLFESRLYFVDQLIGMGAQIVQCDPHRIVVSGPARLHGTHISSPDIRAGMALIIAALGAKGQSIVDNAQVIDRGYQAVDARLRELGADIVRED